ncbi:glycogen debranching protein GlgX [Thalassiella azotivora]
MPVEPAGSTPRASSPGPGPLGVHLTADGARAAVLAAHAEAVEVVLAQDDGGHRVVPLTDRTHGVWHGHLPGVREGQRYGLRVHGPWDPDRGHRHHPDKLLVDPYARALDGDLVWGPELFGHAVDEDWQPVDGPASAGGARRRSALGSLGRVPWSVVVPSPVADPADRPDVPWADTVVYEAHVRGLTMQHPGVPPELRGTYAGLAHPAVIEHLTSLGVTAVELLPVHAAADEPALVRRGLRNYWGYSTLSFFAPEPRYATRAARAAGPAAVLAELAQAVRDLHAAGLEVLLDVVYNHTCEGGVDGPTLSLRGLDAATYYRLDDRGRDADVTGTGGSLDFRNARVVQLALDSLRYWVQAFGVDGFRFDLAPALARGRHGYDPDHPFLVALRTDPVLSRTKLVAEPWDVGHHGWRTGQLPQPLAEWNDLFRDDVRTFWLADAATTARDPRARTHGVRHLATRLAGSADFFGWSAATDSVVRGPLASVNLVTAHDGFTLADLTAYDHKHNEANGEGNRDGHGDNRSWNHGVEGPTDDEVVLAARRRSARALLGTLLLATGVPMLTAGDETGRTQRGNNNAYCLDDPTTWLDWGGSDGLDPDRRALLATTRRLLALRREHPVLRQDTFFAGRPVHADGTIDLAWFGADGTLMDHDGWHDGRRTVQMLLHGQDVTPSVLLVVHGEDRDVDLVLPSRPWADRLDLLWDSAFEHPDDVPATSCEPGGRVRVPGRTLRLYRAVRNGGHPVTGGSPAATPDADDAGDAAG